MTLSHRLGILALTCLVVAGSATPASAQGVAGSAQGAPPPRQQVVSANPFGLLIGLFNAEYERRISPTATAGIGASSYFHDDGDDYVNADVFVRFYPSGQPLQGFALGLKAGPTHQPGIGTGFGIGIDTNWSWLLSERHSFYVGIGFGLKRLLNDDDIGLRFVPTARVINLGIAF